MLIKLYLKHLLIPKKPNKPWFTDDCKRAVKDRKRALRILQKHPTAHNVDQAGIFRAKARRTIKQAKRTSWRNLVSKINHNTSSRTVWNMVKKIQGKNIRQPVHHLLVNSVPVTDPSEIANTLAQTIAHNSSNAHYYLPHSYSI